MDNCLIFFSWSGKRDSNPRPLAWEANALPTELLPRKRCKYSTNISFFAIFGTIFLTKYIKYGKIDFD